MINAERVNYFNELLYIDFVNYLTDLCVTMRKCYQIEHFLCEVGYIRKAPTLAITKALWPSNTV